MAGKGEPYIVHYDHSPAVCMDCGKTRGELTSYKYEDRLNVIVWDKCDCKHFNMPRGSHMHMCDDLCAARDIANTSCRVGGASHRFDGRVYREVSDHRDWRNPRYSKTLCIDSGHRFINPCMGLKCDGTCDTPDNCRRVKKREDMAHPPAPIKGKKRVKRNRYWCERCRAWEFCYTDCNSWNERERERKRIEDSNRRFQRNCLMGGSHV